ncbi:MAG: UvrB/UvrC motif-containing protein [bacterium]
MVWANFLHIYQPPTQKKYWVDRITAESYKKIVAELQGAPKAKLTLNINACLTEMLVNFGYRGLIDDIKDLVLNGQVELTASAKFHPLLTKIPEDEIVRQIRLNDNTNKKYFGRAWEPKGFFPPEMSFNAKLGRLLGKLGYQWVIIDELAHPSGKLNQVKYDRLYKQKDSTIKLFFRERETSFRILSAQLGTGNLLLDELGDRIKRNEYLLTAMDGETFGHHRLGLEKLLFDIYKDSRLPTVRISDLLVMFNKVEEVAPRASTWALMEKDIQRNAPFARWDDPQNEIHKAQWELTNLAMAKVTQSNQEEARKLLDEAIHSDQYWWASAKPWWSLEMIERGASDLLTAIKAVKGLPQKDFNRAYNLYIKIITLGFAWQRSGKVEELARDEDEEIRQLTDRGLPHLSAREINKMIANLDKQRQSAAKKQEYERAGQFRDRIKELDAKKKEIKK